MGRAPTVTPEPSDVPGSRPPAPGGSRWSFWAAWARVIETGTSWLVVAAIVLTGVLGFGLTRLRFSSSQNTMISSRSAVYRENLRYQTSFGGEVMVVVFQGDNIQTLFTAPERAKLAALASSLQRTGRFHAVLDPVTVLNFSADQVQLAPTLATAALARDQDAAAAAARSKAAAAGLGPAEQEAAAQRARDGLAAAFTDRTASDGARLATVGERTLDNPQWVNFLMLDEHGDIRAAESGAFPDTRHALMVLRLRGNMTIDEQGKAAADVVRLVRATHFEGVTTMATGSAALLKEVNDRMRSDMARTGLLAMVVMALVLLFVFRARWRLLVLPLVLLGIVWAFGAMGYLGIPLTMVTISGLPILIGLGVDFAVQVHSRYEEEAFLDGERPLEHALSGLGPALTVAMVAAVAGFLALRLSPVPMIQEFAVMLSVGAAVLLASVLLLVPLVVVWRDRRGVHPLGPGRRFGVERLVRGLTVGAGAHPVWVASIALAIAATGLVVQRSIPVESDPERFVPQNSPVLQDLRHLRDVAGSSADLGVMVEADNVMRPEVLTWMAGYEQRELAAHKSQLLTSSSIASITAQVTGSTPTPADVQAVMKVAPPAIHAMFLSDDGTRAQMDFSVGHLSLNDQSKLLDAMRRDINAPPGVRVTPSGLVVVGIEAVHSLQKGQSTMAFAALGAVLVWLLVWLRRLRKALLTLLPVITAVGASSLAIYLLGVSVSMLGALSSALVIAVCTEFSVLIITRYEEERRLGRSPDAAIATASLRIGRAFTTSGLTTAGGFAVLAMSGFPLLSSFGTVVAVNVIAAMLCALVIVPPLLRWSDRGSAGAIVAAVEPGEAPEAGEAALPEALTA